jgi:hypothetical protein
MPALTGQASVKSFNYTQLPISWLLCFFVAEFKKFEKNPKKLKNFIDYFVISI